MKGTYESVGFTCGSHVLYHLFFQCGKSVVCSFFHFQIIAWIFAELGGEFQIVNDSVVVGVGSSHDFVDFVVGKTKTNHLHGFVEFFLSDITAAVNVELGKDDIESFARLLD